MKRKVYLVLLALVLLFSNNLSSQTYHDLSTGSLSQNWTNIGLITVNNDWSVVPSIIGYRGDNLTTAVGVDPQTVIADSMRVINVTANQTSPNTTTSGGIYEFELTNPVVAFQGSGTADAPFLVFFLNSTGVSNVQFACNLLDIDGSADNAAQAIAFQYRIGTTGDFTNIPAAFVADASTGPSLATLVTPVSFILPAACDNQLQLQIRVITANAAGSDEFIGVDDIVISATTASAPTKLAVTSVNNGVDPYLNTGFYAVVKSLDASNNVSSVASNLNYTISLATGTGTLGGTLTGTILSGTSVDTVFGITYNTVETGISLTATDAAAGLTSGTSTLFNVLALPPAAVKLSLTDINGGVDPFVGIAFTATIEAWDNANNPVNVLAPVNVTLSALYGTGTLGGTLTGIIAAGTNTVTISGITYSAVESNIALKVVDDAAVMIADTSILFNVLAIPPVPQIVITEIMYNSPESGIDSLEFIELFNNGSSAVDLTNFTMTAVGSGTYTFKNDIIAPAGYYLIAVDSVKFNNFYGQTGHKWNFGGLSNTTKTLLLKDSFNALVDSVTYANAAPWPIEAAGNGASITLCDPSLDNSLAANWFASAEIASTDSVNHKIVYASPGAGCTVTSIIENNETTSATVYPNPTNNMFTVSNLSGQTTEIKILDITGNLITDILTNNASSLNIDLGSLPKGVYLLNIIGENGTISVNKIIKM